MSAGISVSNEVIKAYEDMKICEGAPLEEAQQRKKVVLFRLSDDNQQVVVDEDKFISVGAAGDDFYEHFVTLFPDGECRFAVYSATFTFAESGDREKKIFIKWSPKNAPIRSQMIYGSAKEIVRRELAGISAEIEATSREDLDRIKVVAALSREPNSITKLEGKNL